MRSGRTVTDRTVNKEGVLLWACRKTVIEKPGTSLVDTLPVP